MHRFRYADSPHRGDSVPVSKSPAEEFGVRWPGSVVRLKTADYKKQLVLNPLPRVEVWDAAGRLLLLKTIPPNLVQAERVGDEVQWAKASARGRTDR